MRSNSFWLCIGLTSLFVLLIIEGRQVSALGINNENSVPTANPTQSKQNHHQASSGTDALTKRSTLPLIANPNAKINASVTGTAYFTAEHRTRPTLTLQKGMASNEKKSTTISGVPSMNNTGAGSENSIKLKPTSKSNIMVTDKKHSVSISSTLYGKATYKTTKVVSSLPSKETDNKKFTSGSPVIISSLTTSYQGSRKTKPIISYKTTQSSMETKSVTAGTSRSTSNVSTENRFLASTASYAQTTEASQSELSTKINSVNHDMTTGYSSFSNANGASKPTKITSIFGAVTTTRDSSTEFTATPEPVRSYTRNSLPSNMFSTSDNTQEVSSTQSIASLTYTRLNLSTVTSNSNISTTKQLDTTESKSGTTNSLQEHNTSYKGVESSAIVVSNTESMGTNTESMGKSTKNISRNQELWVTTPPMQLNTSVDKSSNSHTKFTSTEINYTQANNISTNAATTENETTTVATTKYYSNRTTTRAIIPTNDGRSEPSTQPASPKETTDNQPSYMSQITGIYRTEQRPYSSHPLSSNTNGNEHSTTNILITDSKLAEIYHSTSQTSENGTMSYHSLSSLPTSDKNDRETTEFQLSSRSQTFDKETTEYQPSFTPRSTDRDTSRFQSSDSSYASDRKTTNIQPFSTLNSTIGITIGIQPSVSSLTSETTKVQPSSSNLATDRETIDIKTSSTSHSSDLETTGFQPPSSSHIYDKETTEFRSSTLHATDKETTEHLTPSIFSATVGETTEYQTFSTFHAMHKESTTKFPLFTTPNATDLETAEYTSRANVEETTKHQPPTTSDATDKDSPTNFSQFSTKHASDIETTEYLPPSTFPATVEETTEYQDPSISHTTNKESSTKLPQFSTPRATDLETTEYFPPSTSRANSVETTEHQNLSTSHATHNESTTFPQFTTPNVTDIETTEYFPPSTSSATDGETTEYQDPSTSHATDKEYTKFPQFTTPNATDIETTEYFPPSTSHANSKETTEHKDLSTSHATHNEPTTFPQFITPNVTDIETTEYFPPSTSSATDWETTEYQDPSTSHATDKESTNFPQFTLNASDIETTEYFPPSTSSATDGKTTEYHDPSTSHATDKESTNFPQFTTPNATDIETTEYFPPSTSHANSKETTEHKDLSTSHATHNEPTTFPQFTTPNVTDIETTEYFPPSTSSATDGETTESQDPSTSHATDKESTKFPQFSTLNSTDIETTEYFPPSTSRANVEETTEYLPPATSHATHKESATTSYVTDSERETTEYQPLTTSHVPDRKTTKYISSMAVSTTYQPPSTSLVTDIETTDYQTLLTLNETTDVPNAHTVSTNVTHQLITDNESTDHHSIDTTLDTSQTEISTIYEKTSVTTENTNMGITPSILGKETSEDTSWVQTFSTSDTASDRLSTKSVGMSSELAVPYTTDDHQTESETFFTYNKLEMTSGVTDSIESNLTDSTTVSPDTTGAHQETSMSTTVESTTEDESIMTDKSPNIKSTEFTIQYLSTTELNSLATTKSSTNHPGEESTWSSTVDILAETTLDLTTPTTKNHGETSTLNEKESVIPLKTTMSIAVMESSSISDKTSIIENLTSETSEQPPVGEFTTLGMMTSFTEEEETTTAALSGEISTTQKIPSTSQQVSDAYSTPMLIEKISSAETAISTTENAETTTFLPDLTSNALSKNTLGLQTRGFSTIPSTKQETGSNTHIAPVYSTIDPLKSSTSTTTDKPETTDETDAHFVTGSDGVSEIPQTSLSVFTTNGDKIPTTSENGFSQSNGISGHQTTFNHQTGSSSSKTNTIVPGIEPVTVESVTGSSYIPARNVTISTQPSVQTDPHIDSAYFKFDIVIWISGTFEKNLKDDLNFQLEIITLVRVNFLPIEFRKIFRLDVATVTKGSIKVHVQAKVLVNSLRGINTTVGNAVQKMVTTLDMVNYTKINTSRGKLYDNKGDVRRSYLLHQNDTECDAVDICESSQKCVLSHNNITAVLCNSIQRACYLECGPNGACIQSVDTTYCRCASDWLNIYYGENCESRAVSLEAQLGITFGSLGVVLIIIFIGCLIRSRRRDKESFLEDDARGWRGFNGGDSRWSTFSGRYSTRDVPYKRSLRDGRYLVPAHDPFGSGRLTRPGLYLPRADGLVDTSFIDAVPSYSQFNFEADFTIKRPVVSKEPSAIYLTDRSWRSLGYTNPAFYDFVEERTHL